MQRRVACKKRRSLCFPARDADQLSLPESRHAVCRSQSPLWCVWYVYAFLSGV